MSAFCLLLLFYMNLVVPAKQNPQPHDKQPLPTSWNYVHLLRRNHITQRCNGSIRSEEILLSTYVIDTCWLDWKIVKLQYISRECRNAGRINKTTKTSTQLLAYIHNKKEMGREKGSGMDWSMFYTSQSLLYITLHCCCELNRRRKRTTKDVFCSVHFSIYSSHWRFRLFDKSASTCGWHE